MKKTLLLILTIANFMFADSYVKNFNFNELGTDQIKLLNQIVKSGQKYKKDVDPYLLAAFSLAETGAKKYVITDKKDYEPVTKGSIGPMQIRLDTVKYVSMYQNHKDLKNLNDYDIVKELFNNVDFSVRITASYIKINKYRFGGSLKKAISLHNGGLENESYVKKVMDNYAVIKEMKKRKMIV